MGGLKETLQSIDSEVTQVEALMDPRLIPDLTLCVLWRYVRTGVPTGGFLEAVLSGDLFEATARADHRNLASLTALVSYIYNYVPVGCYRSAEQYQAWIEEHAELRKESPYELCEQCAGSGLEQNGYACRSCIGTGNTSERDTVAELWERRRSHD